MSYVVTSLGTLPSGGVSIANGVSSTGVIVGSAVDSGHIQRPVYWDALGAIHILPTLNNGGAGSSDQAYNISADGTVIVGVSDPGVDGFVRAVKWTNGPSWTITELAVLVGFPSDGSSVAACCSSNGSAIFGNCFSLAAGGGVPCVWNGAAIAALPAPPLQPQGQVNGCSPDGTHAVGCVTNSSQNGIAAIWTTGTLVTLPSDGADTDFLLPQALGCSATGQTIVGFGWNTFTFSQLGGYWNQSFHVLTSPLHGPNSDCLGCDQTGVFIIGTGDDSVLFLSSAVVWINGVGQQLPVLAGAANRGSQPNAITADATIIVGSGQSPANVQIAAKWQWSGAPAPGAGGPPTGAPPPPPAPRLPVRFLLCQPTDWTLTQPTQTVYGLDHLAGMYVIGLADGVLVGPLLVSADGVATLPFPASAIILGLSFTPQLQTTDFDAGNPTIQGRRKDIIAVTARVKSSLGVQVGANQPDGAALDPPQNAPAWSGMQTVPIPPQSPSYTSPSGQLVTLPITGDMRDTVLSDWETPGQVAIQGTPGLPLYVLACVPELLDGDTVEQTYSKAPEGGQRKREPPAKQGRPVPGSWMLNGDD